MNPIASAVAMVDRQVQRKAWTDAPAIPTDAFDPESPPLPLLLFSMSSKFPFLDTIIEPEPGSPLSPTQRIPVPTAVDVDVPRFKLRATHMTKFVSVPEAAEILSVSEKTVRKMILNGILRACRAGKLLRIPVAELDRFGREG